MDEVELKERRSSGFGGHRRSLSRCCLEIVRATRFVTAVAVEGPDLDVYVMCRASETIPDCVLDETGETHTFQEGDTVAVKYLVIRKPLFEKRFDLL